jgi:Uma2 family endonuclease
MRIVSHALLPTSSRAEHIMAMPSPAVPPAHRTGRRWTAAEVRRLIEENPLQTPRYELVDGELLVTPSPNKPHQVAVKLLLLALEEYLKRNPVGGALTSPFDVELEDESVTQPDIFVLPLDEWRRLNTEMPARKLLLVTEVLSPSSGRHDRVTKRPLYQRRVPEYWIVDLDARLFERWRSGDERPEIIAERLVWSPAGATEAFHLDVVRYFAEVFDEV